MEEEGRGRGAEEVVVLAGGRSREARWRSSTRRSSRRGAAMDDGEEGDVGTRRSSLSLRRRNEGGGDRALGSPWRCACVSGGAREREGWGSSAGGIARVNNGARLGLGPA